MTGHFVFSQIFTWRNECRPGIAGSLPKRYVFPISGQPRECRARPCLGQRHLLSHASTCQPLTARPPKAFSSTNGALLPDWVGVAEGGRKRLVI